MVGPVRNERARRATIYEPKERKVRFHEEEEFFQSTPIKLAPPEPTSAAETHRSRKRKSIEEWRRRASASALGQEIELFFNPPKKTYPRTPIKKARRVKRIPLPTDKKFESPSDGGMWSSPSGKAIGMPEITDFSEAPEVLYKRGGSLFPHVDPYPSPKSSNDFGLPSVPENVCGCSQLHNENIRWQTKYSKLKEKHTKLTRFMKDLRSQLALQGVDVKIEDELMFDADDESEVNQASANMEEVESFFAGPSTPELTMSSNTSPSTSYLLSPVVAEPGTPAAPRTSPSRRIEEDYDDGFSVHGAQNEQAVADAAMDEAVDSLADATSSKLRITEDFDFSFPNFFAPSTLRFEDFSA